MKIGLIGEIEKKGSNNLAAFGIQYPMQKTVDEVNEKASMPQKLQKGLERLEKLDAKQHEINQVMDAIYKTSPVGQAPPIFHRKAQQLVDLATKKAKIWNDIRNFVIPGTSETLWQKALRCRSLGHAFRTYGIEEGTLITAQDIREKILEVEK